MKKNFWCKIGLHSLKVTKQYPITSIAECSKCGKKYIIGLYNELIPID